MQSNDKRYAMNEKEEEQRYYLSANLASRVADG